MATEQLLREAEGMSESDIKNVLTYMRFIKTNPMATFGEKRKRKAISEELIKRRGEILESKKYVKATGRTDEEVGAYIRRMRDEERF